MNRAVFLDRDGVINERLIGDYVKKVSEFRILPGVETALKAFKKKAYLIIVITNQQGVGKHLMTEEDLKRVHEYMLEKLPEIDDIFYCTDLATKPNNCRKPSPHMILKAKEKWNINLKKSWMIGDSETDIEAGIKAGCKTIRITQQEPTKTKANHTAKNLLEASKIINNKSY